MTIELNKQYYLGIRDEVQITQRVLDYCLIAPGWNQIITDLLLDLDKPEMIWDGRITQVKEKFGSLRFYIGGATSAVFDRIHEAERLTEKTCMICGKPGKIYTNGWWQALCPEHAASRGYTDEDYK